MVENIEKILTGVCPTCKEESEFKYRGPFRLLEDDEISQLYNCIKCKSTISLESFNEYNDSKESSQ